MISLDQIGSLQSLNKLGGPLQAPLRSFSAGHQCRVCLLFTELSPDRQSYVTTTQHHKGPRPVVLQPSAANPCSTGAIQERQRQTGSARFPENALLEHSQRQIIGSRAEQQTGWLYAIGPTQLHQIVQKLLHHRE